MATPTDAHLRGVREAIVRRHAEAEGRRDALTPLSPTSHSARYESAPFGVSDGEAAVRDLLNTMITGFPDWHIETGPFRHGDDFVFVEVGSSGTKGPWAGWNQPGERWTSP